MYFIISVLLYFADVFLINFVYNDLGSVFGWYQLSFAQMMMVLLFLVMGKLIVIGYPYTDVKVYLDMSSKDRIKSKINHLIAMLFLIAIYLIAKQFI